MTWCLPPMVLVIASFYRAVVLGRPGETVAEWWPGRCHCTNEPPRLELTSDNADRRHPRRCRSAASSLRPARPGAAWASALWDLETLDGLGIAAVQLLLWQQWGERRPSQLRLRPEHEPLLRLAQLPPAVQPPRRHSPAPVTRLGAAVLAEPFICVNDDPAGAVDAGSSVSWSGPGFRGGRFRQHPQERGGRALLITGLVRADRRRLSYSSALQLRLLGGEALHRQPGWGR